MQTLHVVVFGATKDFGGCSVVRDITAAGSVATYLTLKDIRALDEGPPNDVQGPLFLQVTCQEPCKPHVSAHFTGMNAADAKPTEIQCSVGEPGGPPLVCGSVAGRVSRRSPAHFVFSCSKQNGCFEGLNPTESDIIEITLSPKQQGALKEGGGPSPFVLLAAWDCVPETPTIDEEGAPAEATACKTIETHGSVKEVLYLSARASTARGPVVFLNH